MLLGRDLAHAGVFTLVQRRQAAFVVTLGVVARGVVLVFLVKLEEAVECDGLAIGAQGELVVGRPDVDGDPVDLGFGHFGG